MQNQSLKQIIDELPQDFLNEVFNADVSWLNKKLKTTKDLKKRAVIQARIQRINHLVI